MGQIKVWQILALFHGYILSVKSFSSFQSRFAVRQGSLLHAQSLKMDNMVDGTTNCRNNWRTCGSQVIQNIVNGDGDGDSSGVFPFDRVMESVEWSEEAYESALNLYDKLMDCDDSYVALKIQEALKCLDGAYRLYSPKCVIGSYNGGKDAVAILHLMRAAHAHYYRTQSGVSRIRPRVIYFDHADEFPQILDLLQSTVQQFDLDMLAFDAGVSFQQGLEGLVKSQPSPLAFVLGTRTSDPNAMRQGHFAPSSSYMPPFMRVNPILDWTYGHVWHFLRLFQLPYCSLYDDGFTSLGTVHDTFPCPALRRPQGGYWPAYMLADWSQERAGRLSKEQLAEREASVPPTPILAPSISSLSFMNHLAPSEAAVTTEDGTTAASVCSTSSEQELGSTVGLLIIGDEILKGLCNDTNTFAAANALRANGLLLSRVVVVPDEHDAIVHEIHRLEREVDLIITSGGVGATHDDVTMRAVASALHWPLMYHQEMGDFIQMKMGDLKSEAQTKMATLPKHGKLRYLAGPTEWPTLQCRNIYVLPGVPQFFQTKISTLASHLAIEAVRSITCKVVLSVDETKIVDTLNQVVAKHPNVTIGSYPFVDHPDFKTVVTIEGNEGPALFEGDTRVSIRKRSESLKRQISQQNNSTTVGLFTKEEMDLHVKLALGDLIATLPKGSVLRVANDDGLQ